MEKLKKKPKPAKLIAFYITVILLFKVRCVSVTCSRWKTKTNTLQHVTDGKPGLTLYNKKQMENQD